MLRSSGICQLPWDSASTIASIRSEYAHMGWTNYLLIENVPVPQLLKGNDIISTDALRPFHMWLTAYSRQRQNAPTPEEIIDSLAEYMYECRFPTRSGDLLSVLPKLVEDTFQSRELLPDAKIVLKGYMLKSDPQPQSSPKPSWMRILTHFEARSPSVSR